MPQLLDFFLSNPELLLNETHLHNALHDYYTKDIPSLNLMMMAYKAIDVPTQVLRDHPKLDLEKEQWRKRLCYDYSIEKRKAGPVINQWAGIFCEELKQRIKEVIKNQQLERQRITNLCEQVEQMIEDNQYEEAENLLNSIKQTQESISTLARLWSEINNVKKVTKSQINQAIQEFGDGQFGSYDVGIKTVAHVLDIYPDFQQAQIWLKNNPRETKVKNPTILSSPKSEQCTISWQDDDPYTRYTVCRADGHYPQDPNDGYCVCSEIANCKITDNLPIDKPGAIWKYSIFAIRILDKQWKKTEVPREAVWLPDLENVNAEVSKDNKGRPIICLTWKKVSQNSAGVHILRYDNYNNDFMYSNTILDVDPTNHSHQEAQTSERFIDVDVYSGITYRYIIKQVWRAGLTSYKSQGIMIERTIP